MNHLDKVKKIARIYARDGRLCYYCGRLLMRIDEVEAYKHRDGTSLPANYPTLDHVVPRVRGGLAVFNNLVVACQHCNSVQKSHRAVEELSIPRVKEIRKVNAAVCGRCNGYGDRWSTEAQERILCDDCLGAGVMDIDHLAQRLYEVRLEFTSTREKLKGARKEITRLREIIDDYFNFRDAWQDRDTLIKRLKSKEKTIKNMREQFRQISNVE